MTREEFIRRAQGEVNVATNAYRNRMWNLIEQAWAEGKRNAEKEAVTKIVESAIRDAIARLEEVSGDEVPMVRKGERETAYGDLHHQE